MNASENAYILIAEDDQTYSHVYETKFKKEGIKVKVVKDGNEAIKAAQTEIPSLIVLDIIMPEKDGWDVLEELQADEKLKDVPVLVFSNLSQDEDISRAKEMGATDYLVKSNLSVQEMVDTVKKYIT